MIVSEKLPFFLLRVSMGWLLLYAGITKVLNPEWSAAGYLNSAKTFAGLYQWFASPANITWVNFLNEWGLTLIGLSLLLGVAVRFFSFWGMVLMLLYYFPVLEFPHVGGHSYLVDEHIIYTFVLLLFVTTSAGRHFSLGTVLRRKNFPRWLS